MNSSASMATIVFGILAAGAAMAAKPQPPPPPPPPPPAAPCPGDFPAYVYTTPRPYVVKRRTYNGSNIVVANSDASCSVVVSTSDAGGIGASFRHIGTESRIVWAEGSGIKMLKFNVVGGAVVQSVPMAPSNVFLMAQQLSSAVTETALSNDGNTIYYSDEKLANNLWVTTLQSIDITTCSSLCSAQLLYSTIDTGIAGLSINATEDRIYMAVHNRPIDLRSISFLQKSGGVWGGLRHVVTELDAPYVTSFGLSGTAFSRIDYNNSGSAKDVLVIDVENVYGGGVTMDVLDVSNCGAGGSQSCLSQGEAVIVRPPIVGAGPSFRGNNLIYYNYNTGLITATDLVNMVTTPIVIGQNPESSE